MKNLLKIIFTFLLISQVHSVFGWGMTGHRVIAEIAERHLNKKVKRNIQKIIGDQKLAYWSNWVDFIKSDPDPALNTTGSWHFVNAPANQIYDDIKTNNVLSYKYIYDFKYIWEECLLKAGLRLAKELNEIYG